MPDITRATPIAELPELLTVDEAARWLGVSRGVLYTLAREHDEAGARIGRLLRIRKSWLATLAGHNGNGGDQ